MRMSSTAAVAPPPRTTIARATQIHIEEPAGDSRIDRDCRLNRELCRGIAALGADGECMLAIRKCRKVACLQRNKDTAFARFVAVRRNRVAVHKNFGKVRVCGI